MRHMWRQRRCLGPCTLPGQSVSTHFMRHCAEKRSRGLGAERLLPTRQETPHADLQGSVQNRSRGGKKFYTFDVYLNLLPFPFSFMVIWFICVNKRWPYIRKGLGSPLHPASFCVNELKADAVHFLCCSPSRYFCPYPDYAKIPVRPGQS